MKRAHFFLFQDILFYLFYFMIRGFQRKHSLQTVADINHLLCIASEKQASN